MRQDLFMTGFGTANNVIGATLAGITQEESVQPVGLDGNCINWIAGHQLWSRVNICKTLGIEPPTVLPENGAELYKMGSGPMTAAAAAMPLAQIAAGLVELNSAIQAHLATMEDSAFDRILDPFPFPRPVKTPNLETLLTFFLFHDAYHVGQLSLARRVLGKSSALGF